MFRDSVQVLLLVAVTGQIIYLWLLSSHAYKSGKLIVPDEFGRLPMVKGAPVSIIICARNEADNLRRNLESILSQHYLQHGKPDFEVIVVNDASTDHTREVLAEFAANRKHLRIIEIPPDADRCFPGKKYPLSVGIAAASHDYLLLTDADCCPAGKLWMTRMCAPFWAGKEIVAGYGAYRKASGWLNRFIRCETVFTFFQLHRMALLDMPYMAVGRNMAVKKSLLLAAQEHPLWSITPSGDDDLLVRLCATPNNFYVNTHPESFTCTDAKATLGEYLSQKQRHMSTGKLYRLPVKIWLGMNGLCHTLFWCTLPVWIVGVGLHGLTPNSYIVLILVATRMLDLYMHFGEWSKRLGEKNLTTFLPVFDILLAAYNIILSPYILWKTRQRWK